MRFNVDRMGEQYQDVTTAWLASITTMTELDLIKSLKVGERFYCLRSVTGSVGKTRKLEVIRIK